jgi:glycosyltransferase involved in cell wall biosynthesis
MIIALVSDAIYPYFKGGKEKRIYELSIRLVKMGHEVHIYTMKWWEGPKIIVEEGVYLHGITKLQPLYKGERRSIKEGIVFGLSCLSLIREKFDIVDVDHMPYFPLYSMWVVCRLKRKPFFATWNEVWGKRYWIEYMGIGGYVASVIEKISIYLPDKIITNSLHTGQSLHDILKYKKPTTVISPGLDLKRIKNIKKAAKGYNIIYAGRLLKHKNIDLLIGAVKELKKRGQINSCLIIGDGPEKARLLKLAKEQGVSGIVTFDDFYDKQEDLYARIKASKVFALPSSREGFGIVAIEANACGIPVVTNANGNNAAQDLIVNGSNGFTFDGTVTDFASSLQIALSECNSLQPNCLKFAKSFDWNKLTKQLAGVYEQ